MAIRPAAARSAARLVPPRHTRIDTYMYQGKEGSLPVLGPGVGVGVRVLWLAGGESIPGFSLRISQSVSFSIVFKRSSSPAASLPAPDDRARSRELSGCWSDAMKKS